MSDNKRDPQTFAIIGAAMEVHRVLKRGFVEAIYQDALAVEFASAGIPFEREACIPVFYKGGKLPTVHRVDFLCFAEVVVEVKACDVANQIVEAQVINYLRASGARRALVLNFAGDSLGYKRFIHTPAQPQKIRVDLCQSAVRKERLRSVAERKQFWGNPPIPPAP